MSCSAHGGGGRLSHQMIQKMFVSQFHNEFLDQSHDGAIIPVNGSRLAFTTDSYVVNPIFFPGGDIGMLAVNGTVNDLAMCGAIPLYLSAAFIIEEGLPMDDLWRVVLSMQEAANPRVVHVDVSRDSQSNPQDLVFLLVELLFTFGYESMQLA